jgi:hypothetical protein
MNDRLLKKLILKEIKDILSEQESPLKEQDSKCGTCNLRRGCKGEIVSEFVRSFAMHVQKVSDTQGGTYHGIKLTKSDIDGLVGEYWKKTFGPYTEKWVKIYQKTNAKVEPTGIADKDLFRFVGLGSMCNK